MVKVYAPLMSLDASGSLGKAIVFSKWKGRNYVRKHVKPANPQSVLQVSTRAMMRFLSQAWTSVGSTPQGTWDDPAAGLNVSPFNYFIKANMQRYREFQVPSQSYPAAETGTEPVLTLDSATGGPSYIDVAFTVTTLNDIWGLLLFRSPTGTFTPSRANCIRAIEVDGTGALVYTDSNLDAGDYYYDAVCFTKEGLSFTEEGEQMGTAT